MVVCADAGDILALLNKGNMVSNGAAQGQGGLPPGLSRSNSGLQQLGELEGHLIFCF